MSILQRRTKKNLGKTEAPLYTVPLSKSAVLIGANVSNLLATTIRVDFILRTSDGDHFIVKELPIPPNAAFTFSGLEQKLVLSAGDIALVKSSDNNSGDVWMSFSEMEA